MILILDNFDSFTYNLVDYFYQLKLKVEVLRNDTPIHQLVSDKYSAVVLSPGPGTPRKAGRLMEVIKYYHLKVPVLGICLGHQALGEYFKGDVIKAKMPKHGKISSVNHEGDPLFNNLPASFNVVRYHSLICANLPDDLSIIAKTGSGEIMALKHKELPIYGLQFHPEAILTEYGLEILRNWKHLNCLSD